MIGIQAVSCSLEQEGMVISFRSEKETTPLVVSNIVASISDTIFPNTEVRIVSDDWPVFLFASLNAKNATLYIENNSHLQVHNEENGIVYHGNISDKNRFLLTFDSLIQSQVDHMGYNELYRKPFTDFHAVVSERIEELKSLLFNRFEHENATDFRLVLLERIRAIEKLYYLEYPENHTLLTGRKFEEKDYKNLASVDLSDLHNPDFLSSQEGRMYLKALITKYLSQDYGTGDYYLNLYEYTKEVGINKNIRSYLGYVFLREHIHFSDSIQMDYVEEFIRSSANGLMQSRLIKAVSEKQRFQKGSTAPSFQGIDDEGVKISPEDLRGAWIYLDVWAMWCGPCYREFPYFRDLADLYNEKPIRFVGLSVDGVQEYEKWKRFIKDKKMGGIQLFAENGWESEVIKNYNISSIPRFVLIDPDGLIYNAEAPWPSDPQLISLLNKILE